MILLSKRSEVASSFKKRDDYGVADFPGCVLMHLFAASVDIGMQIHWMRYEGK